MRTSLIILFSFLFIQFSQAQETLREKIKQLTVISTTGLNLRSEPNLESKVLSTIPYGHKVEVLSYESFGLDTVGFHTFNRYTENEGTKSEKIFVQGYWRKVKYEKINGYAFDAYLGGIASPHKHHSDLNQDYILLFPSAHGSCFNNYYYSDSLSWYGFYKKKDAVLIKPIEVSFFKNHSSFFDFEISNYMISAKRNKDLMFMIGIKDELRIKGTFNKIGINEDRRITNWGPYSLNTAFLEKHNISYKKEQNSNIKISLNQNGITQILNPKNLLIDFVNFISWIGDIDGDGKDDYIINYGEKSGTTILYLSSAAEEGQIVKPVAIFYSGYCC